MVWSQHECSVLAGSFSIPQPATTYFDSNQQILPHLGAETPQSLDRLWASLGMLMDGFSHGRSRADGLTCIHSQCEVFGYKTDASRLAPFEPMECRITMCISVTNLPCVLDHDGPLVTMARTYRSRWRVPCQANKGPAHPGPRRLGSPWQRTGPTRPSVSSAIVQCIEDSGDLWLPDRSTACPWKLEQASGTARITSKELAPINSVKNGILQNACSTSRRMDADLRKSALLRIARLKNSRAKRSKKNGDKSAVALLNRNERHQRTGRLVLDAYSSNTRQLGCVFQDMEPPKSSSILRKSSNVRKPIRCVQFTKAVVRHADIRDQNPSRGMISLGDPHQRDPNAPKFEDRSQEERCACEAAWRLAKSIQKLKEKNKEAFFSLSDNWCLPAPSNLKLEEREFVVDSRASMHMINKKELEFC